MQALKYVHILRKIRPSIASFRGKVCEIWGGGRHWLWPAVWDMFQPGGTLGPGASGAGPAAGVAAGVGTAGGGPG
jgi:hypothetical protein